MTQCDGVARLSQQGEILVSVIGRRGCVPSGVPLGRLPSVPDCCISRTVSAKRVPSGGETVFHWEGI